MENNNTKVTGINGKIAEDLKKQFTLLTVDFYDDGKSISTFVFYANEVSENEADNLWEDYDEKYQADEFDGAFEDYLTEKGIGYWIL